ncbi:MAG: FkbM family methyltransferase [Blautia sp.]|nr:FkbM family methyltransferase [Blautia sp.]
MVKGINITLFKVQYLENIHTLNQWLSRVGDFLSSQVSRPNQIDRDFYYAIMYAEVVNADDMASQIKKSFMNMDEVTRGRFINFYHDFSYFWGELDITDKPQGAIRERITILKENRSDLVWLYERLSDYRSKRVLSNMLLNWLTFDVGLITGMKENTFPDYFDPDIFAFNEDEVIVDLGAYIGDTALEYIDQIGRYKKIYCYEITGESVDKMKRKLKLYKNIEIRQKGAAQKAGVMHVSKSDIRSTSNRLAESAGDDIEVVALDEDIQERITFLKMDIEGAEQSAVLGSREHILKDRPKLAISVYHSNRDIIEIPKLISSIRDDYRYYLRSHGNQWAPSEITLFGV